jgi:hypothetical protein
MRMKNEENQLGDHTSMIRRATFEMHSRWRTNAMLLFFASAIASIPVFAQQDNGGCENALKELQDSNKKLKSLPYVCPKALGAQLQSVLAKIKDQTPNGYQFQKAILHIETGSTTEIDAGVNLVVFTISYKHKKGLTQSMDSIFGLPEKKAALPAALSLLPKELVRNRSSSSGFAHAGTSTRETLTMYQFPLW